MATIASYDAHIEQLFEVAERLKSAFDAAGIHYRVVGGLAVFLHVTDRDPLAARTTRDIDVAVHRADLDRIRTAGFDAGFEFRHAAGVDMLIDRKSPAARSAVHFIFIDERVQADYLEPVPFMRDAVKTDDGLWMASVADLLTMKLTSFRLKDQVHIQDMDGAGLIDDAAESALSAELRARLDEVRKAT